MTKRAVLYARVSKNDVNKDGRNLQGQLDMCRDLALTRQYIIVAEMAEDETGASGAEYNLPQLSQIIDMAAEKKFDVLIVRELDRLSRKLVKQLVVEEELKSLGVLVEYVLADYPDTPEGNLMKNIRATVAEYEREKIKERMSRGRRLKVKSGSVLTHGKRSLGYELVQDGNRQMLQICEPEADVVRLIFSLYTEGDENGDQPAIVGITRHLNALGLPTHVDRHPEIGHSKTRGYGQWSRSAVWNILKNETYCGTWRYGKNGDYSQGIAVQVPAIVSRETWEAAQHRLKDNFKNHDKVKHEYLLRGHVVCSDCGHRMQATPNYAPNGKIYFYYHCRTSKDYAAACSNTITYSAQSLDPAVWEWVKEILQDPHNIQQGLESFRTQQAQASEPIRSRLSAVKDMISENKQQLERLLDLYLMASFSREMLEGRQARLEGSMRSLQQEEKKLINALEDHEFNEDRLTRISEMASQIAPSLDLAEQSFDLRRKIVELLQIQAVLQRDEDGQKVANVSCILSDKLLQVKSNRSGRAGRTRSPPWPGRATGCGHRTNGATI